MNILDIAIAKQMSGSNSGNGGNSSSTSGVKTFYSDSADTFSTTPVYLDAELTEEAAFEDYKDAIDNYSAIVVVVDNDRYWIQSAECEYIDGENYHASLSAGYLMTSGNVHVHYLWGIEEASGDLEQK